MRKLGIVRQLNSVGGIIERRDHTQDGVLFRFEDIEGKRDAIRIGSWVSFDQRMAVNGRHLAKNIRLAAAKDER